MRILILLFFAFTFSFGEMKFPTLSARVVDNANILQSDTRNYLEMILKNEEQNTTNQVVVASVKSLQGYEIEQYSNALAREWGIGQKDSDNGVLLLIAPNEKKVRIEVGYGLEGVLSDKISHEIITYTLIPAFKKGKFDAGIVDAVNQILKVISGEKFQTRDSEVDIFSDASNLGMIFTLMSFILLPLGDFLKSKVVTKMGVSAFFSSIFTSFVVFPLGLGAVIFILVFLTLFALFFFLMKDMRFKKVASGNSGTYFEHFDSRGGNFSRDFGGFSSGFEGGFGGGGGSFGGGGASGGW